MGNRIAKLPISRGYRVPWFVHWNEQGQPDFRVVEKAKFYKAIKEKRCWICGEPLGAYRAFVVGPMCAINRTSSDPPSHLSCAEYAVQECPFLNNPEAVRRDVNMPETSEEPAGVFIKRNPGVSLIYVTKSIQVFWAGNGYLLEMGEPVAMHWWTRGRKATKQEVIDSIESGCPILLAEAEKEGPAAMAYLEHRKQWLLQKVEEIA